MVLHPLLAGKSPLKVDDAAAAIIVVEADGYLMQLRDSRPDIWYPGHWGLFGGATEPGEEPRQALVRELREELELEVEKAEFFARFDFDFSGVGLRPFYRDYYIVPITRAAVAQLVQHEGAAMQVFTGEEILMQPQVTPYDKFALFFYHARSRFDPA
jgi:8-oxo-dGTP pyrophosphatase MutT (NUDIX family)